MQGYLHIGGNEDGLTHPTPNDAETVTWPSGITGKETYHRVTLSADDEAITIYVHASLTLAQALDLLVGNYKAWAKNRPGSRL